MHRGWKEKRRVPRLQRRQRRTQMWVKYLTSKLYNASNQGHVMLVNHCAFLAVHLKWRYIFASLIASAVTFLILVCLWLNKVSVIIDLWRGKIHNQEHPKVMQLGLLLLRNESNNRLTIHCILLYASKPLNDLPFQSNVRSKSALETALSTNLKIPLSRSIAHISTMKL